MVKIPSRLEELLPVGAFERVLDALHRPELSQRVREAVARVGLKDMNPLEQVQEAWQQARTWLGSIAGDTRRVSSQMINATGCLFFDDSDLAPMASSIGLSMAKASSSFLDRQHCLRRSAEVVPRCIGASHHVWLSDPSIALQTAIRSLGPRRVVIARSDCVRIPGLGDIFSIASSSGASILEIGPTNGASPSDWQAALSENGGNSEGTVIVTVSPNALSHPQSSESRENLISAARNKGVPVVELLADGSVDRNLCQQYGFPFVSERTSDARTVVLLPSHFLLGGARGVLCAGDEASVSKIQRAANLLGVELESPAIVANLLVLQLGCLEDDLERGMVGALRINPDNLHSRSQRLATQLNGLGDIATAEVVTSQHRLGPSPWDKYSLTNSVVRLSTTKPASPIAERLKLGSAEVTSIAVRQSGESLFVDLRFVHPDDDHQIVSALRPIAD